MNLLDEELLADLRGPYRDGPCRVCRGEHARQWFKPMDVGGRDGSHHSATLARLVKAGVVLRRSFGGGFCRPAYAYRIAGDAVCPKETE